jgi:transcriptional regulator with XRE-family HTH domain
MGRANECREMLYQSYACYTLLHRKARAKRVLEDAENIFGMELKTYGIENLEYDEPEYDESFEPEEAAGCADIGEFIGGLRKSAGISQRKLCKGICNASTYNRIENGLIHGHVYLLEPLMQRLGRDINLYFNTFLSARDFEEKQIRDGFEHFMVARQFEQAERLIDDLAAKKRYQKGVNLQFIKIARSSVVACREGFSDNYINMVTDALKITIHGFDEQKLETYRLSYNEIFLVNKTALYYIETNETERGIRIFYKLRDSMNNSYADETEKARMYPMVLYNLSRHLERNNRYDEALEISKEGKEQEVNRQRLSLLPGFAVNNALTFFNAGKKDESIPYFALAYYGSFVTGGVVNPNSIGGYAKENLHMIFD